MNTRRGWGRGGLSATEQLGGVWMGGAVSTTLSRRKGCVVGQDAVLRGEEGFSLARVKEVSSQPPARGPDLMHLHHLAFGTARQVTPNSFALTV